MKLNWMRRQQLTGYLFIAPNMIGVSLFIIIPALFSIFLAFTNWEFPQLKADFVGLNNFTRLFQDEVFYTSLKNTLIFLGSVPISVGLGFMTALVLNKSVFLKNALRTMFFLPYITTGVAIAFVWMLIFQPEDGPINTLLMSIGIDHPPGWLSSTSSAIFVFDIIWIWYLLGYNIIVYLAALQEVSNELLEASRIDGARKLHTIRFVIWPLVSPTTLFLLMTGFIVSIKQMGIFQAITDGGPGNSTTVLSLFIYKTAFRYYDMGYASAISVFLLFIIIAITAIQWIAQKKWVHYS
ncbi:carbohydrate ABC transporter permease [Paenibacillus nasutitermitis]|uniref:Binding-protein-dependent transport system inner membrane protein n=1 Tax=Paenibacillus nasutitermitis TaxID=1652958 RepID=A0A916Z7S8_9BACL|nr:sugar ABC transporter permease [Paenibacillus nasutitermitis]GGD80051.1 binding-protein-dependent transport system inner membrane protein [Paenibacillus nasutitermitis]